MFFLKNKSLFIFLKNYFFYRFRTSSNSMAFFNILQQHIIEFLHTISTWWQQKVTISV